MNLANFDGIGWLLLMLGPLIFLQRILHREIQALILIITQRPSVTLAIFSVLFLPGVALHEASHYFMARILRVKVGRVSLVPRQLKGGKLRMGFVETAQTDAVRDALIGAAPLITGSAVVAYIGIVRMGLLPIGDELITGQLGLFWQRMTLLPLLPDFWVWFYLSFVVSSTMLPSSSDRRTWLPVLFAVLCVVVVALIIGAGPWLSETIAPTFNQVMRSISIIFAISVAVHIIILLPIWLLRILAGRLTGLTVD